MKHDGRRMTWYENPAPGYSWPSLWSDYILCGKCQGIRLLEGNCSACDDRQPPGLAVKAILSDGREVELSRTYMGAEGRAEDYLYLEMLQREWERPAPNFDRFKSCPPSERPSARIALVLLFWSYFETRIERLLSQAMRNLSEAVRKDLLDRYSGIGARLYRLYKIMFGGTYFDDLSEMGFQNVATLLEDLHKLRNDFSHGNPAAINEATVLSLIDLLKAEHEAWIAVFNKRARKGCSQI